MPEPRGEFGAASDRCPVAPAHVDLDRARLRHLLREPRHATAVGRERTALCPAAEGGPRVAGGRLLGTHLERQAVLRPCAALDVDHGAVLCRLRVDGVRAPTADGHRMRPHDPRDVASGATARRSADCAVRGAVACGDAAVLAVRPAALRRRVHGCVAHGRLGACAPRRRRADHEPAQPLDRASARGVRLHGEGAGHPRALPGRAVLRLVVGPSAGHVGCAAPAPRRGRHRAAGVAVVRLHGDPVRAPRLHRQALRPLPLRARDREHRDA